MKLFRLALLLLILACPALAQDDGRMYCVYIPAKRPFGKTMEKALIDSKGFDQLTEGITKVFKLPRDLPLVFAETGEVNAWYDGNTHRITMSYEFMEFLAKLFSKQNSNTDEVGNLVAGTTMFTLFHELGHALISELDLPTTGREEDCADEFATLLLNGFGKEGQEWALSAAVWFKLMAENRAGKPPIFWDEHSLDEQRFYDIFALIYGSDPNRYSFIEKIVPAPRLRRSLADFKRKDRNWERLLHPHLKVAL